ncbi:hypothetical protein [Candidatus Magnetaquicoccus inordinatus]|uniref:hypothetical protein n=1 Tax=Candidatus Magnetaquicoccus inordinatus TaxID=2496818 RepID=UPI00102CDB8A|nr:hypothetical protein [Candidatus Magnetaquicoccus inordinatus]
MRIGLGLLLIVLPGWLLAGQGTLWLEREQKEAEERYRECLLHRVQATPSALAAGKLQWACQRRYSLERQGEVMDLEDCLLRYLPQVQNDASAQAMITMCEEQFAPRQRQEGHEGMNRLWRWLEGNRPPAAGQGDWRLDGERFEALQPWQGGQGR